MANTRKTAVTQLPDGRSDNCIQFTITDTSDAFVFKNIIPMESTYMFSCWVKTAADTAQITVGDQTKDVGSSWTEVKVKLKLKAGNLQIVFNNSTIYYLYHPILERGNLPTKWTPNPDDTDAKLAGLQESVSKYNTKFNAIDGQISGLVEKTTIKKADNSIISLQDAYSQFVQTENGIKSNIENITKSYDGQIKDLKTSIEANANGVKSTVKSIENVQTAVDNAQTAASNAQTAVDNIQVGGRNLLSGTKDFSKHPGASGVLCGVDFTRENFEFRGLSVFSSTKESGVNKGIEWVVSEYALGETLTFSFYAKGTGGKVSAFFYGVDGYPKARPVKSTGVNNYPNSSYGDGRVNLNITESWERYFVVWEIANEGDASIPKKVLIRTDPTTVGGTVLIAGLKLERGNKLTDWTSAPEDVESSIDAAQSTADTAVSNANAAQTAVNSAKTAADKAQSAADSAKTAADAAKNAAETNATDLTNYITKNTATLTEMQSLIDGSIMTWFFPCPPADATEPTSKWTTTDLKNQHLGDLYYDTDTGYCYRYQVEHQVYSWQRITDVDVTKALADAKNAQDTADGKRRVFVAQPTPPYDVGDLWTAGANGDIKRCRIAKTSEQSYAASDWELAGKYTDDTTAKKAQDTADSAKSKIDNLKVGGRNLLIGRESGIERTFSYPSSGYSDPIAWHDGISLPPETDFTLSFEAKSSENGNQIDSYFFNPSNITRTESPQGITDYVDGHMPTKLTTEWQRYWIHFTGPVAASRSLIVCRLWAGKGTGTVSIRKIKLELGNKPTDWTPAPEDVEGSIDAAQSTADTAVSNANAAQTAASNAQTAADKANSDLAKLTDTVTTQGTQINQNSDSITSVANRTTTVENKFTNYYTKTETNSQIKQTSEQIRLSVTKVSDKVQNLNAGGNNLLHHSDDLIYQNYTFQSGYIGGSGQNIGTASGQQLTSVTAGKAQNTTSAHSLPTTTGLSQIFVDDGSDIKRMDKEQFKKSLNIMPDTRDTNENPLWYMSNYPRQTIDEFKISAKIGLSVTGVPTYVALRTTSPWSDSTGGYPTQQVQVNNKLYTRYGTSNTAWSEWKESYRPKYEFDFDAAGDPVFIQHT